MIKIKNGIEYRGCSLCRGDWKTLAAIEERFRRAGVEFIGENGGGPCPAFAFAVETTIGRRRAIANRSVLTGAQFWAEQSQFS